MSCSSDRKHAMSEMFETKVLAMYVSLWDACEGLLETSFLESTQTQIQT